MKRKFTGISKTHRLVRGIIFLGFLTAFVQIGQAQSKTIANSFVIVENKNPGQAEFYKKSIEGADMEQYRMQNKRVRLIFSNGFELELLSAKELFVKGANINLNNYQTAQANNIEAPVFTVLDSGHLTARAFTNSKK